ncbi:hypothetical protein CYY_010244 [Polysphondylium violaceum]|uniref:HECT-type E3 ubiquitin transferase n=1 Tax=Polysphondylium violaceum TaxID=133409 RepID=A0A8J4UV93_9MYCE|nr:hypothetical protein CYY_010244 [Polysphondylium violaceum]
MVPFVYDAKQQTTDSGAETFDGDSDSGRFEPVPFNNSFWIYGGSYSYTPVELVNPPLLVINNTGGEFYEQRFNGFYPDTVWGHSCDSQYRFNSSAQDIYMFGGSKDTYTANTVSGELWRFNRLHQKWSLLSNYQPPYNNSNSNNSNNTNTGSSSSSNMYNSNSLKELYPFPRTLHSSTINETTLFIFGGIGLKEYNDSSSSKRLFNDLWMYNIKENSWFLFEPKSLSDPYPSGRFGHTMVLLEHMLYVFGGLKTPDSIMATNELWAFDTLSMQWTFVDYGPDGSQRAYHTMIPESRKDRGFFVYGGWDFIEAKQDLWSYDVASLAWKQIKYSFQSPLLKFSATAISDEINGFILYGGGGESGQFWGYGLGCSCNNRGGCSYGACSCFSGYFGEHCEFSIDGPILLGLGLAISVPILCFGWCVLRCIALPIRIKVLTLLIIVMSFSLFASLKSCLACWLPVAILGLISGLGGLLGIFKFKGAKIILYFTISVFLTIGANVYGIVSFLPSCMMGNCRNDSPEKLWLPKYAVIMDFVHLAFLILVLPLNLKLYRQRKYIDRLNNNPSSGSIFPTGNSTSLTVLVKKIADIDEAGSSSGDKKSESSHQKALNYLQKEHQLRVELSKIRVAKQSLESTRINVNRAQVMEDSYFQLAALPSEQLLHNIHISFIGEDGIDMGGLRNEWFSLLFKQIFDPLYGLFVTNSNYTLSINPSSNIQSDHLSYFSFAGKMVGRAIIDGIHLEHRFSRTIYKTILGQPACIDDLIYVDPLYHKSLMWILENDVNEMEEVTFSTTVDNFGEAILIDLKPGGRDILVTEENKNEFVQLISEWRFKRDISDQCFHFTMGFREIIPPHLLSQFNECELELLICGLVEINVTDWKLNTMYRGYTSTSSVIEWFWEIVEEMEMEDRIRLLQFSTGNARLPPTGFQGLVCAESTIKFQIHKSFNPDNQLPIARTCFNRLDLPNYDSKESLKNALQLAIHEGLPYFGLN